MTTTSKARLRSSNCHGFEWYIRGGIRAPVPAVHIPAGRLADPFAWLVPLIRGNIDGRGLFVFGHRIYLSSIKFLREQICIRFDLLTFVIMFDTIILLHYKIGWVVC